MKNIFVKYSLILLIAFFSINQVYSQNDSVSNKSKEKTTYNSEIPPQFPGGETALISFINKNIKYPKKAVKKNIQGTVYVKFLINKSGEAVNFEIMNKVKLGYGLEEAAIEVLKKMPKWSPGYQNKIPVEVSLVIPITFKVKS